MPENRALPAAIYCRISRDRDGENLGVDRQEADCRALAERLGWEVAAVFVDNDISASTKAKKPRPQYDGMLRDARAGRFDAILAYSNSRLTRRPMEWLQLIDLANSGRIRIKTVASGEHDLSRADGRATALTLAVWDAAEAERTAERVARQKKEAAADGKYRGGPRPYGYEYKDKRDRKQGMVLRENEATIIREGTTAVLAGRTLAAVARELNEQGLTTSTGKPWTYARLRDVLIRPRNAGLLSRGRHDRGPAGFEIVGPATWPAIVEEETWRAVHTLLVDPSRRRQDGNASRWLGSGIYACGKCGGLMRAAPHGGTKSRPHTRRFLYRCVSSAHLTINCRQTDEYVRGVVAEMVRDPRIVAAMHPHIEADLAADRERRAVLAARLAGFETDYALGSITGAQLHKATTTVTAELAEVDARLADGIRRSTASPILGVADPGAAFLAAPVDVQRAVLRSLLRIEVMPASYRGTGWSSERLRLNSAS